MAPSGDSARSNRPVDGDGAELAVAGDDAATAGRSIAYMVVVRVLLVAIAALLILVLLPAVVGAVTTAT